MVPPPVLVTVNVVSLTWLACSVPKDRLVVETAQEGGGGVVMPLPVQWTVSQGEPMRVHSVWVMAITADVGPSTWGVKLRLNASEVPARTVWARDVATMPGLA